jgi:hypothetical protein
MGPHDGRGESSFEEDGPEVSFIRNTVHKLACTPIDYRCDCQISNCKYGVKFTAKIKVGVEKCTVHTYRQKDARSSNASM